MKIHRSNSQWSTCQTYQKANTSLKFFVELIVVYFGWRKNSKDKIFRATKNIPNVKCTDIGHFSAYDILKFKKIIFTETSVKELEKRYN